MAVRVGMGVRVGVRVRVRVRVAVTCAITHRHNTCIRVDTHCGEREHVELGKGHGG